MQFFFENFANKSAVVGCFMPMELNGEECEVSEQKRKVNSTNDDETK